jgi:hypothetical protein
MGIIVNWLVVILMGVGFAAFVALLAIKPAFVNAAAWLKALFLLAFALASISMVLVFAFGLQAFRPPLLYPNAAAFAGFFVASGYLRRIGLIR